MTHAVPFRRTLVRVILSLAALVVPAVAGAQSYVDSCKAPGGKDTWSIESLSHEAVKVDPITGQEVNEDRFFQQVEIHCRDMTFFADLARLSTSGNRLIAEGHVVFLQTGSRLSASKVDFDLKKQTGTFYNASGSIALQPGKIDKSLFGTAEPDAFFWGEKIEKVGPRTYRLTNGSFTTCVQPEPRWEMATSETELTLDEHAIMHNMVLKVKGVPIFYLPIMYYPIRSGSRQTGILMPSYGHSTIMGLTLSNAVFVAMGLSQDVTLYHDYYSKLGQGFGADYRYVASAGSKGTVSLHVVKAKPITDTSGLVTTPAHTSYQYRGDMTQGIGSFRLMANVNYFTDLQTVQTQQQNLFDLSQRLRTIAVSGSGNWGAFRLSSLAALYDTYYGTTTATRTGSMPRVSVGYAETPIGGSQVYVGFSADYNAILRQGSIGDPSTSFGLTRLEIYPTLRAVLTQWSFLSISSGVSYRLTHWDQSYDAAGVQKPLPLTRQLVDLQASVTGPSFSRIFDTPGNGYAERFKHVIEPTFRVHRLTDFAEFNRVVINDGTDSIVGGVTQFDYSIANRILAKRRVEGGASTAREILSFIVQQSYYTDARAAQYDFQYQSSLGTAPTTKFSPMQMSLTARPTDGTSAAMSLEYDLHVGHLRTLTASGSLSTPMVSVTPSWSKRFFIPGLAGFEKAAATQAINMSTLVKSRDNSLAGSWNWSYDFLRKLMMQQRFAFHYTAQCCGLAVEFQTVNFGGLGYAGVAVDHRFNISFTLAGIGSFSNQMGAFGDNIR